MIASSIEALIGKTPPVRINSLSDETGTTIFGKCEFMNPTSSVKDRIALNMINKAIEAGKIGKDTTIIEPTSGNTDIGLAAICAAKKLKLILTMPDSMSIERQKLLTYLRAELVLTPASLGMNGSIEKADALEKELDDAIVLQQFQNPDNPEIHRETTAVEILNDTDVNVDIFIVAVGTGGTLTGTSKALKATLPALTAIAVEPTTSAVLSGSSTGFIPDILNTSIYDETIAVKVEGLLVGISSRANLHAAYQTALKPENKGKVIVTILCDTTERYLSTELF